MVHVVPRPVRTTPLTVLAIAVALGNGSAASRAQEGPAADLALGMFAEATALWAQHQALILATIGVIALQSALIAALSVQFFRRRRAEGSLKQSEDRWRSVVESPIFGISFIDRNHRFISTNQTYQRMVGYTNDELRQLTPLDISVPGEREVNDMLFKELREGKRQHFEMVKQLRRKDGRLIWIQLYVFGIPDAETNEQLLFGMMQDITESKQSQDALAATRAELARVARVNRFGAMTASIAHEINQPLAAMVANANAAQRWLANPTPDLDEVRAALKRIGSDRGRTGPRHPCHVQERRPEARPGRSQPARLRGARTRAGRPSRTPRLGLHRSLCRHSPGHGRPGAAAAGDHEPRHQRHGRDGTGHRPAADPAGEVRNPGW
jgi:PAS domain S-box-containing protein